jgi:transcriptional regulator with XRE-family HTH domain
VVYNKKQIHEMCARGEKRMGNIALIEARKKAGVTQREFANSLGLKLRTYSAYERNERIPRGINLSKICTTLGLDANDFYPITKSER